MIVRNFSALVLLAGQSAFAAEFLERDLQIHGFISQGIIESNNSDYVNDDKDISFELTEVGVNASYKLSPTLRVAGQLVYLNGGNRYAEGARLDYLLLDWSAYHSDNWQANFLFGRYKNYNWLYSSTRDVPHTRPSIILPQSIYFDGFRDIAVGGDGVAALLKRSDDTFGEFEFNLSFGTSKITEKQTKILLSEFATGNMTHDYDVQGSIFWTPIESQWRVGVSVVDADFSYSKGQQDLFEDNEIILQRYMINALYEAEDWEFSAEFIQERFVLDGFYFDEFHQDNMGQGLFVQTRYQWQERIKLLARIERFYANKDDKNGSELEKNSGGLIRDYFGYQHDVVVGLTYDLTDNMQAQFEHHWFEGTARLTPVVAPNSVVNDSKHWRTWAIQFMYWF